MSREEEIEYWNNRKPLKDDKWFTLNSYKDKEFYDSFICPSLIRLGAIAKKDLINNQTYTGFCRNSSTAIWHSDRNCFTYQRHKWGSTYEEEISHFEDDMVNDVFIPINKI